MNLIFKKIWWWTYFGVIHNGASIYDLKCLGGCISIDALHRTVHALTNTINHRKRVIFKGNDRAAPAGDQSRANVRVA